MEILDEKISVIPYVESRHFELIEHWTKQAGGGVADPRLFVDGVVAARNDSGPFAALFVDRSVSHPVAYLRAFSRDAYAPPSLVAKAQRELCEWLQASCRREGYDLLVGSYEPSGIEEIETHNMVVIQEGLTICGFVI